jgi:hypothetical protein
MGRSRDFAKVHFLRIADLGADRSKRQLSAHNVGMCTAQHLLPLALHDVSN